MDSAAQPHIDTIHRFWFGELNEDGLCAPQHHALWFKASDETDSTIAERFGHLVELALKGELATWAETEHGLIALILLLDQFTRNLYRHTPQAFAGDPIALNLAQRYIARGLHPKLPTIHQVFLYLPLEHSEDLAIQQQSVSLFEDLSRSTGLAQVEDFARFAAAHRDVTAKFGRFPHRNVILGRTSSPAELDYLKTHGGF